MATSVTAVNKAQLVLSAALLAGLMVAAQLSGVSAMAAPFAATCALLALLPRAPFSQPRVLVLSHLICIGVGAVGALAEAPVLLVVLLMTWLATTAMATSQSLHAPAVAHTVILSLGKQPLERYMLAALATTIGLAAVAYLSARREQATTASLRT
jgi:hypothetical protein